MLSLLIHSICYEVTLSIYPNIFRMWMLAVVLISLVILGYLCGAYLIYRLIKYIDSKPPGLQSLVDHVYKHKFWFWILSYFMMILSNCLRFVTPMPISLAIFIGWTTMFLMMCNHLNMIFSGLFRLFLIIYPEERENLTDDHVKGFLW